MRLWNISEPLSFLWVSLLRTAHGAAGEEIRGKDREAESYGGREE